MAATFSSSFAPAGRQPAFHAPVPAIAASVAPSGTFAPGTKVQVGGHRVVIEKYLSEGGFAHVYLVRLPKLINGDDAAVLKRVAVPDKESLANMRTEVETMKKLKGRRHIVTYMDSHASELRGGGYEVFLLMEYCNGGGLMDFMNTRLQNRLTEPEILSIFSDVAHGVANMHYLSPPLLHRDLKVENVLITTSGSSRRYKLCDFGSAAAPTPAATNAAEGRLIEEDVQLHTTLQYRSPEMIDVYRRQPIDEKSDIWALGVLLYKLCYYKTPFDDQGQMAILNAKFKFPGYPMFSDDLKKLIATMLRENPQLRPNIYQVLRNVCFLRGTDIPIKDIYGARNAAQSSVISSPMVGAYQVPVVKEELVLPNIIPMRRGRPTKTEPEQRVTMPTSTPMDSVANDPFEALDGKSPLALTQGFEDVASRFPPLDEFSILHDPGSKFAFDINSDPATKIPKDIRERVTDALADDAFARPSVQHTAASQPSKLVHPDLRTNEAADLSKLKSTQFSSTPKDLSQRPLMVSTGTMTSYPAPANPPTVASSPRPTFRFPPSEHRSSSHPRGHSNPIPSTNPSNTLRPVTVSNKRPGILTTTSSRSSLEGQRPSLLSAGSTISRSKSVSSRARPSSVYDERKTSVPRSRERSPENAHQNQPSIEKYQTGYLQSGFPSLIDTDNGTEAGRISSNVEFLRAIEEQDPSKRKEKRLSSGSKHTKRSSLPSISLSGTKSLLAGRFGDAFRRFEGGGPGPRGPSPSRTDRDLAPIVGSEQTDSRSDDGYSALEETEAISPEIRRELERRRLSQEEKRVADAGVAYRQMLAKNTDDSIRGVGVPPGEVGQQQVINSRAASIQSKVKTLLDENGKASPTKPDEKFPRFPPPQQQPKPQMNQAGLGLSPRPRQQFSPVSHRKPPVSNKRNSAISQSPPPPPPTLTKPNPDTIPTQHKSRPPSSSSSSVIPSPFPPRPNAPLKPHALRTTGTSRGDLDPSPSNLIKPTPIGSNKSQNPSPSIPDMASTTSATSATAAAAAVSEEDWEINFSKRYPALSGLEMVETEIDSSVNPGPRMRDV